MNAESALCQAMIDQPTDLVVRGVWADWLDENNRGDEAEFVRRQIMSEQSDTPVLAWRRVRKPNGGRYRLADIIQLPPWQYEWRFQMRLNAITLSTASSEVTWTLGRITMLAGTGAELLKCRSMVADHPIREVNIVHATARYNQFREWKQTLTDVYGNMKVNYLRRLSRKTFGYDAQLTKVRYNESTTPTEEKSTVG